MANPLHSNQTFFFLKSSSSPEMAATFLQLLRQPLWHHCPVFFLSSPTRPAVGKYCQLCLKYIQKMTAFHHVFDHHTGQSLHLFIKIASSLVSLLLHFLPYNPFSKWQTDKLFKLLSLIMLLFCSSDSGASLHRGLSTCT